MVSPSARRRALTAAGIGLAFGLGGCAADDVVTRAPVPSGDALLTPWLSINGGWRVDPQRPLQPPAAPRLKFVQPVGVAALGNALLVADAGTRTLWRVDRSRDALLALAPFAGGAAEQGAALLLGNDLSAWVALPAEHMVVQYDARGRVVRRWRDEANAPRPVAIALPQDRSELLVGDGASAEIIVFDPLGRARRLLGAPGAPALQSIAAMAFGPRGLYVLDRVAQQVVVLGAAGEVLEVIGENRLAHPRALAVDASGRVFVADDMDQQIKVFRGPRLLVSVGGTGSAPGRFGRIEALALDANLLYVADSINARIEVLLVAPPSMEPAGDAQ